jgi:hypothetical protein
VASVRKSVEEKIEEYEKELARRRLVEPGWQDNSTFILPKRSDILFNRQPGQNRFEKVMDSTAILSNVVLAASMQGSLVSSAVRWFSLAIRDIELAPNHKLRLLLDQCADMMYSAIQQSNHASETSEMCLDLGALGQGGLFVEENDPEPGRIFTGLRHTALHPGEFCIGESPDGYVDTVYRMFKLPIRVAYRKWGNALSPKTLERREKHGTEEIEFLHVVTPNDYQSKRAAKWPVYSCYIEYGEKHRVEEGGYEEFPFMFPRWSKSTGEIYGTGPGHVAIHDTKTLNKAVELKLRGWALMVNPPIQVRDQGVIGTVKLNPFGQTHVRDMESIKPLWEVGGRMDIADMEEDKLRQQIRRVFYSDQLQLQEGPQMTAYEVQVRYELMQRVLGPTLGRLEVEWLNPYIERVFWIMLRRSQKDSPFRQVAAMLKKMGKPLDIEYEGPLARAQRLQESIALQRFFQIALPIGEAFPDSLDKIDPDEILDIHGFATGIPARALRSPEALQKIRDAKAKARADQANQQAALTSMETAGKGASAAKALAEASASGVVPPIAGNMAVQAVPRAA